MIENIIFFVFIPLISIGIIVLGYYIRKNKRYDIFFGIDWDFVPTKNRNKLLNWITSIVITFGIISTFYFPAIHLISLSDSQGLLIYFGVGITMAFMVILAIERHSKRY